MARKNKKKEKLFWIELFIVMFLLVNIAMFYDNFKVALTPNKIPEFRDDIVVKFNQEDLDMLEDLYKERKNEYLFCLIGSKDNGNYIIESIEEVELEKATEISFVSKEENACKKENHLGTLHKHPRVSFFKRFIYEARLSTPSIQDIFAFGQMRKPLHIIQFDKDKFYASEYITELDFKSIKIEIKK